MNWRRFGFACAVVAGFAGPLHAQSWRLRLDAGAQRVQFRGLSADSVADTDVHTGPTGGLVSPDGFAVDCIGDGFCRFFRPGAIINGVPASLGADLTMWGFGVAGLSVHVNARLLSDLSGDSVFTGSAPPFRLIEGFAQYIRDGLTIEMGRTLERGRLASVGSSGLDGLRAAWRPGTGTFEVGGYAGWGMARGTVLAVNSPAVDPLADYQPDSRQIVTGLLVGAHLPALDVQAEYRRELDPDTRYIVAERAAVSMQATPRPRLRFALGADYDIAQAAWGSADASASYSSPQITATLSARHYRPFFDLSTVWGVFSPVPFNGVSASVAVNPTQRLQLRSRAEWFRYDAAGVSVPAVPLKDEGVRWSVGATFAPIAGWTAELDTHGEAQPGASSSGVDGRIAWHPQPAIDLTLSGGSLERPLELRFQDAGVTYAGASAGYRLGEQWRLDLSIDRYWESDARPDAGAIDWNQWRLSARASLTLRSSADRWLPPARSPATSP